MLNENITNTNDSEGNITGRNVGSCTLTIYANEPESKAQHLINEFRDYERETNEITVTASPKNPEKYHVLYNSWKGISWALGAPYEYVGRRWCRVEAHVNPKVFTGIEDYRLISPIDYLRMLETNFNTELRKITNILKDFSGFKLGRGKYFLDFELEKINCPCTAEQVLVLLNQGRIPFVYDEYRAHLQSNNSTNSYLPSPMDFSNPSSESVIVNFYEKYPQKKSPKSFNRGYGYRNNSNRGRGFGNKDFNPHGHYQKSGSYGYSSQGYNSQGYNNQGYNSQGYGNRNFGNQSYGNQNSNTDTSGSTIRFEVNYNYRNNLLMENLLTDTTNETNHILNMMFSDEVCRDIICDYFNWVAFKGNYHSLDYAKIILKRDIPDESHVSRLVSTLELVAQYKGVSK